MPNCYECNKYKDDNKFKLQRNGKRTKVCTSCLGKRELKSNPKRFAVRSAKVRRDKPWRAILADSRKSDKKKGLSNDLDLEFVKSLILLGCSYCGENSIRITLDRIDNAIGHIKENVVPACIRCNYTRGSMPYEAWILISPKMKEARELGLFGDWRSLPLNRKELPKPSEYLKRQKK